MVQVLNISFPFDDETKLVPGDGFCYAWGLVGADEVITSVTCTWDGGGEEHGQDCMNATHHNVHDVDGTKYWSSRFEQLPGSMVITLTVEGEDGSGGGLEAQTADFMVGASFGNEKKP